uniref:Aryl hydrocarbon receptor n=1 Tax=Ruditapes philippinarum TaxID=129788 RepID=B9VAX1_RUDPH|nr:aryl hydrocarbon receptor [Ruditapes philippinarum]
MVEDWVIKTMYATKRRRRTVKSVKTPVKDHPPKSNPSKRHRERLNGELDHLASLLPFEQSVISKLDKLSILRLGVSYLRAKSYFQAVLPGNRYNLDHGLIGRSHLFADPSFSEGESILQALYGFLFVVTCDSEVFYASRTVEQYLGFHQSDIIHQSVMELIHSEDREEFKRQLTWNSMLPADKSNLTLHEIMMPENYHYLHRSFTVRFRCLLDNTSGFITLEISGWIRVMHGQPNRSEDPQLALFATCCPFGPLSLMDLPSRELTFKSKHKMDFSPLSMDNRGRMMFGYGDRELASKSGYDLIHPDDLNYFSAAHEELIKTGSAGLIAYRWFTKDFQWVWLQSSCKVIYKNSKPDFSSFTPQQPIVVADQDPSHKHGSVFRLPSQLDSDISEFVFQVPFKIKGKKNKQKMDLCRHMGKREMCRENGLTTYPQYNGYEGSDYKPNDNSYFPYVTLAMGKSIRNMGISCTRMCTKASVATLSWTDMATPVVPSRSCIPSCTSSCSVAMAASRIQRTSQQDLFALCINLDLQVEECFVVWNNSIQTAMLRNLHFTVEMHSSIFRCIPRNMWIRWTYPGTALPYMTYRAWRIPYTFRSLRCTDTSTMVRTCNLQRSGRYVLLLLSNRTARNRTIPCFRSFCNKKRSYSSNSSFFPLYYFRANGKSTCEYLYQYVCGQGVRHVGTVLYNEPQLHSTIRQYWYSQTERYGWWRGIKQSHIRGNPSVCDTDSHCKQDSEQSLCYTALSGRYSCPRCEISVATSVSSIAQFLR